MEGGGIIYSYNLVRYLVKMGHQVKVFCGDDASGAKAEVLKKETIDGVEITRINTEREKMFYKFFPFFLYCNQRTALIFEDYLLVDRPDLVHFHTPVDLDTQLVPVCKKLGIPTLATLHDGWWICRQGFLSNRTYSLPCKRRSFADCILCVADLKKEERLHGIKFCFRLLRSILNTPLIDARIYNHLKQIEILISPSEFLAKKYTGAGIEKEKIVILRHGVDTAIFKGMHRRPSERIRFGFFGGTNIPIKGFGVLIKAAGKIADKNKFSLDIRGDIEEVITKDAIEKSPGLDIKFHNRFTRGQILEVFSNIDVLVVSSLVAESCSLVILEAFAAGVPVIAVNAGGIPELVRKGENGLLFNFGDADDLAQKIKKILEYPALIREFAAQIKPVKSIEENAEEIVKVYVRLLKTGK